MVGTVEYGPVRLLGKTGLWSCAILLAVVWFGNFFELGEFSLYADDWLFLGVRSMSPWTVSGWLDGLSTYPGGRVGQWSLIYLSGALISGFGSLRAGYLCLFLLTATSILTVWWALTYRFSNTVALLAAAVLAISPLVSIRPFLNGIASPAAVSFLMIASVLYIRDRRLAAYVVSVLVIVCYELVFPLFILMPILLRPVQTRRDIQRFVGHAMICVAMIGADAVLINLSAGDRLRAGIGGHGAMEVAAGILDVMIRSFRGGLSGSVNVLGWLQKLHGMADVQYWAIVAFAAFAGILHRIAPAGAAKGPDDRRLLAQTLLVLSLMALLGYSLVYFVSPLGAGGVFGRETRFHGAANLPLSILSAMILVGLSGLAPPGWPRRCVTALEASYLAAMFAFSMSHQNDFALAAERQRLVVSQLAIDHPMMDPHATFVIRFADTEKRDRQAIEYDDTYSWYPMLRTLFTFPGGPPGSAGPVIRIVRQASWPQYLTPGPDGRLDWTGLVYPQEPEQAGHIWYYELSLDGVLTPLRTPIMVGGRNILHDGPDDVEGAVNLGRLPKLPLFDLIMKRDAAILDAVARQNEAARPEPGTN